MSGRGDVHSNPVPQRGDSIFSREPETITIREVRGSGSAAEPYQLDADQGAWTFLEYSYDGAATYISFLSWPAILRDLPCVFEADAYLRSRKVPQDLWLPPDIGQPEELLSLPLAPPGPAKLALLSETCGTGTAERRIVHLREGSVSYTTDLIGDGTELIHYTYDGVATSMEFSPNLGVRLDEDSIPLGREVWELLNKNGILRCSGVHRPQLLRHRPPSWGSKGYAEILYDLSDDGENNILELAPGLVLFTSALGIPRRLNITDLSRPVDLRSVPTADRVAAILEHHGVAVVR